MAAKKLKTSEKATLLTKLTGVLKKKYGSKAPKDDRAVLECYLYAACLEDTTDDAASAAYAKLLDSFHDLNEIRVSTVMEIERPLASLPQPEFRAMRIREALHHVFEKHFAFDLDSLKKKNLDGATSDLEAITAVTPFLKNFTLQSGLGAHVIPIDTNQLQVLKWLGIVDRKADADAAAEDLKSAVRKNDGPLFAYLLRHCSSEPVVVEDISLTIDDDGDEIDPASRIKLLEDLLTGKRKPTKKKAAATKKASTKKSSAKKASKKKAKASTKSASSKAAPKSKKATTKKSATKTATKTAKKKAAKKSTKKKTAKK